MSSLGLTVSVEKKKTKKLFLVLDLDHTLLNTTSISKLTPAEIEYLTPRSLDPTKQLNPNNNNNNGGGGLYKFQNSESMTKLRPFVHTFLEEASRLFEMYIYTLGDRNYAIKMTSLLDPNSHYFGEDRVFSREDCMKKGYLQKDLDVVAGGVQSDECIIIDNSMRVWNPNCWDSLIQIKEYNYFNSSSGLNRNYSMSRCKTDESESNGSLAKILEILRQVHAIYFDDSYDLDANKDVRKILISIFRGNNISLDTRW